MRDITEIDKNFKSESKLDLSDVCFYDVKENLWSLYGLSYDKGFRRMPENIACGVNESVCALHTNTAGGRIRFRTDSSYVAIRAVMPEKISHSHMANTGTSGFDISEKGDFVRTFIPPVNSGEYEGIHHFSDSRERDITIHFPLYNNVTHLYIGLKEGSSFKKPIPYGNPNRIVYYGSSITQGGCVSRPSMAYPAQVAIKLDCDFLNLGFSAGAKGEPVMAEYIAGLNPDIFVMDYDHNAPNPDFLEKTHEKFFKTFRKLQKNVPVVLMSAPDVRFQSEWWLQRRDIVYRTYKNALAEGDKNVYFIDGKKLWGDEDWRMCSSDRIHPNDMGHYRMAQTVFPVIRKILDNIK